MIFSLPIFTSYNLCKKGGGGAKYTKSDSQVTDRKETDNVIAKKKKNRQTDKYQFTRHNIGN